MQGDDAMHKSKFALVEAPLSLSTNSSSSILVQAPKTKKTGVFASQSWESTSETQKVQCVVHNIDWIKDKKERVNYY